MKPGVKNFAHVEGVLAFEPRVNPTAGGSGVTNLLIEVGTGWKDATCRIGVVALHRDVAVPSGLKAGSYVIAEGRIVARSYDDKKTGAKVHVTEVVAESVEAPPHKQTQAKPTQRTQSREEDAGGDDLPF